MNISLSITYCKERARERGDDDDDDNDTLLHKDKDLKTFETA